MFDTLGEALPKEIERVEALLALYEATPNGIFATVRVDLMQSDIRIAYKSLSDGDRVGMIRSYRSLKSWRL